jgi:hypothetical protein
MSSQSHKMVNKLSHLIENGHNLSCEEVGQESLQMMQMIAKNPSLRSTLLSVKEALQAIYAAVEKEEYTPRNDLDEEIAMHLRRLIHAH